MPVGAEAVEFLRASRQIGTLLAKLVGLQTSFGLQPGEDLKDRIAEKMKSADGREQLALVQDARNDLDEASLAFANAWLPRLSPDLAKIDADGVGNILRRTGYTNSPLISALQDMVRASRGAEKEEDGLDDLPFPDLPHDRV